MCALSSSACSEPASGAAALGGIGQRHDGVSVLARVRSQLVAAELAALPPAVERMLEDVPAAADLVEAGDEAHGDPSVEG